MPLLELKDVRTDIRLKRSTVHALDGVSLTVDAGQTLGIVGESGCGKTMTAMSIMQLLPSGGSVTGGEILLDGRNLLALSEPEMGKVRGNDIGMIFQDPMTSLNPTMTIGKQISESVRIHRGISKKEAHERAIEVLSLVGMPSPERRALDFPHQLSGGMRQRAMIGMALANEPKLLIADEPTTALDVTVQAQILALLARLQHELGMAIMLVTHDLGVVAEVADEIAVMYAGRIVERGSTEQVLTAPSHPYTWGLLRSIPRLDGAVSELEPIAGRPPSLISPPSGCHVPPRCPYALPDHARIDPALAPLAGGAAPASRPSDPPHLAACLLEPDVRAALWSRLRAGESAEQARAAAGLTDLGIEPDGADAGLASETHG